MPAFLERVEAERSFVLRVGPEARKFGDPYTASGTIVDLGNGAAEIKGFSGAKGHQTSLAIQQEIMDCLKEAGFTHVQWERIKRSVAIKL